MNELVSSYLVDFISFFKLLLFYTRYFALNLKIQKVVFFKNYPCISDPTFNTTNVPFIPLFLGSRVWLVTKIYVILNHKLSWALTKLCKLRQVQNFAQGKVWKTGGDCNCFNLTFCNCSLESNLVFQLQFSNSCPIFWWQGTKISKYHVYLLNKGNDIQKYFISTKEKISRSELEFVKLHFPECSP